MQRIDTLTSGDCCGSLIFDGMTLSEMLISDPPSLSSPIKSQCLLLFGRMVCMNGKTDANEILFELKLEIWRCPSGQPHFTWLKNIANDLIDMALLEARAVSSKYISSRYDLDLTSDL